MHRLIHSLTLLLLLSVSAFAQDGWKAGLARIEITPEEPMWMAGYGARDRPAEGTLQPLWLKVLALEDAEGRRAAFVSSDLLGFPRSISLFVTGRLEEKLGLRRSRILLTASHTHCGPVLRDALYDIYPLDEQEKAKIEAYSSWLERQVVETVVEAFGAMAPAFLEAGEGESRFAVNRRNNTVEEVLRGDSLRGPVDHSVPVLAVRDGVGRLLAAVFGYACHNTTLADYEWNGDYAGFAQEFLEETFPDAHALFFSGCAGDQNPLPRRTVELAREYGRRLSDSVTKVLRAEMTPLSPSLEAAFSEIPLPLAAPPGEEELRSHLDAEDSTATTRRWAGRLLDKLERGEDLIREVPYPVQVWRLGGRQLWISLGGEVVVDYSLRLKRELGDSVWVTAYANDVMAYIPSLRVLREGGYEGDYSMKVYGLPALWDPGVEEIVVWEVHRLVRSLESK